MSHSSTFDQHVGACQQVGCGLPLAQALAISTRLEGVVLDSPGVERAEISGAVRRRCQQIARIDVLVAGAGLDGVVASLRRSPDVGLIAESSPSQVRVIVQDALEVEIKLVPVAQFGAAWLFSTGSGAHYRALGLRAEELGLRLSEAGLLRGDQVVAARTEQEMFSALGLPYIPPELREGAGEVEAARAGELPRLVGLGALRGDLHVRTNCSDGQASLETMVAAARTLGREYIAITDALYPLSHGFDEAALTRQIAEIRGLRARSPGIGILCGVELNPAADGSLSVSAALLDQLDLVGVALYSDFEQTRAEATARVVRALENPRVAVFLIPTCRASGPCLPLRLDFDAVIAAAVRTGTALGIDPRPECFPEREQFIRAAARAGAKLLINSNARTPAALGDADHAAIYMARRAWAERGQALNTLPLPEFLRALKVWDRPIAKAAPRRRTTMVRHRVQH
jgi:DNA polymerase (family 10)